MTRVTRPALGLLVVATVVAVSASAAAAGGSVEPAGTKLAPVKRYLVDHTSRLDAFTRAFRASATRYYAAARAEGFDHRRLWRQQPARVGAEVARLKRLWVAGNPLYERVEGIVAGTPTLAVYDVILDAGSSAAEDPAGAVPFDLRLPDGRVLRKPGNLFNLTEGMLWGTRPEFVAAKVDLDWDGKLEFGEVLPEANALKAAADAFVLYAGKLDRTARAWTPSASDAFTSVVVMVPTMSEYFGQWRVSRFVLGARAEGDAFNVVSRLSDISDILGGLRVIYAGIRPAIAKVDAAQAAQTKRELDALWSSVRRLQAQERSGRRFTPEQAELLGRGAQERATAIAGQVSQAAARLGVTIVQ
jgi:hypothetical protein